MTQGGDGFQSAVDPTNPDIIYAEYLILPTSGATGTSR